MLCPSKLWFGTLKSFHKNALDSEDFEDFFRSLHTFASHNVFVSWDSVLYEGLVDLRLEGFLSEDAFPTQSQKADVLAASPRLRSLILVDFRIQGEEESTFSPIHLKDRQVLRLESDFPEGLRSVCPPLTASPNPVSTNIALSYDPGFIARA